MSLVRPSFLLARPTFFTHPFSVCAVQPILPAIEAKVAHRYAFGLVIQHQPYRAVTDHQRKPVRFLARHRSTFSGAEASDKPGAVHRRCVP
jgi:hypothetical protein